MLGFDIAWKRQLIEGNSCINPMNDTLRMNLRMSLPNGPESHGLERRIATRKIITG